MSEHHLYQALKLRYPENAYAMFSHVRNSTGWGDRTADAVCFGLWPSRGLEVEGFEMKCSRSDWTRELKNPAKAESICKYCDRWWIVVSNDDIVRDGELPPTWGLLVLKGEKLFTKVKAPKLNAIPISKEFICAFLRRVQEDSVNRQMIQPQIEEAYQRGRKAGEDGMRMTMVQNQYDELRKAVDTFEKTSGVKIDRWSGEDIGSIVKLIQQRGVKHVLSDMERFRDGLARTLKAFEEGLVTAREDLNSDCEKMS